jgi:hypothetical protein
MDDYDLQMLAQIIAAEWEKTRGAYCEAGAPFGDTERSVEIWAEYGQLTTVN